MTIEALMLNASYETVNAWNAGFQGAVTVTNEGSASETGWTVTFRATFEIGQIWGGRIVSREGDLYTIEGLSWNSTLAPGQSASFGFIGDPGGDPIAVSALTVNGDPVDDTEPDPVATIADTAVDEAAGTATVTVTLDAAASEAVEIAYTTQNGTAGAGDFTATAGTLTLAPGETSATITIPITDDNLDEADETFSVRLTNADGATLGDDRATVTIRDDDETPAVVPDVTIASTEVAEGDPTAGLGWLSTSGSQIVDEAGNPVIISGVNWFGGETTRMAPDGLFARNYKDMMDQMVELGFNTIRLPFSNDALRPGATPNDINYAINPELQGLTTLEVFDAIVDYAGEIGLRIILDNHRNAAGDGASGNGLWYGEGYTEAEWVADWEMLAARYGDNPTVVGFDLSNEPHSATWGTGNAATDWRLGAEKAIDAIHAINPNVLVLVEGIGGDYWWGGNLKGVADHPIRLDQTDKLVYSPHAYPNSIYNQPWFSDPAFPNNLTEVWSENWGYIAEQNIAPIVIGEFGSRLTDPKDVAWFDEFVPYLDSLGASWLFWSWNPNSGDTGGILADDWQTVNTEKVARLEAIQGGDLGSGSGETNAERLIFVDVSLSEATTEPVTVAFETVDGTATAGTDYEAATGTVNFAPGETEIRIPITLLANTIEDGDRTFTVRLTSADGGTLVDTDATVTIRDDDDAAAPPTLSIADATHGEGEGTIALEVRLDAPATETVTADVSAIDGTADGADFTLQTTELIFAPGEDRAIINVALTDDQAVEGSETFRIALSGIDGATAGDTTATVTITDNDSPDPADDDPNGDGVTASIGVDDDWGSGFVARGTVDNDSGADLSGWTLELTLDAEIVNIWSAEILSRSGDTYVIGNVDYNATVGDGQTISWGFQAAGPSGPITLSDVDTGAFV